MGQRAIFEKVAYADLNARAKENYNFHVIAAKLAEYGYASLRLSDDYGGADFLAVHIDGEQILRVQLKGRLTFDQKYAESNIYIAFREGERIFVYPHDELRQRIQESERLRSPKHSEWWDHGCRSWPSIPKYQESLLEEYRI